MDRYLVHINEMYQSLNIIEQLIDNIPEGDFYVKQKPIIKCPEGQWYYSVEGVAGEFGVYLDSRGDKSPYRTSFQFSVFNFQFSVFNSHIDGSDATPFT